jgi:hypothetical protein
VVKSESTLEFSFFLAYDMRICSCYVLHSHTQQLKFDEEASLCYCGLHQTQMITVGIDYSHLEVILLERQGIEMLDLSFRKPKYLAIAKGSGNYVSLQNLFLSFRQL